MADMQTLYTTRGEWAAVYVRGFLFNPLGEWIGFVRDGNQVYSLSGIYVGWLTNDFRILGKREYDDRRPRAEPPPNPGRVRPPATVPLPPLMAEVGFDTIDVLQEAPERLPTMDFDQARQDMD